MIRIIKKESLKDGIIKKILEYLHAAMNMYANEDMCMCMLLNIYTCVYFCMYINIQICALYHIDSMFVDILH